MALIELGQQGDNAGIIKQIVVSPANAIEALQNLPNDHPLYFKFGEIEGLILKQRPKLELTSNMIQNWLLVELGVNNKPLQVRVQLLLCLCLRLRLHHHHHLFFSIEKKLKEPYFSEHQQRAAQTLQHKMSSLVAKAQDMDLRPCTSQN